MALPSCLDQLRLLHAKPRLQKLLPQTTCRTEGATLPFRNTWDPLGGMSNTVRISPFHHEVMIHGPSGLLLMQSAYDIQHLLMMYYSL